MVEDYRKYLSYDNGKGVLISSNERDILDKKGINYEVELGELIFILDNYLKDDYDLELEEILIRLSEVYYYNMVNK